MNAGRSSANAGDRLAGLPAPLRLQVEAAMAALQAGRAADAAAGLDSILRALPAQAEVLRLRALAHLHLGEVAPAIARLQAALAARPGDGLLATQLGGAFAQAGDLAAAEHWFRQATDWTPALVDAWYNLGLALDARAATAEARGAFARVLTLQAGHVPARLRLAELDKVSGDLGAAEAAYRAVLAGDAGSIPAWVGLASLPAWRPDEAALARMLSLRDAAGLPPGHATPLAFACASMLERCGRHDEAFDAYVAANARKRCTLQWNAAAVSALVDAILAAFPADTEAHDATRGAGVVFIVGMPRSGSSVFEHILASHPQVLGGGERNAVARLLQDESVARRQAFPQWVSAATSADWQRLGARYLADASGERAGKAVFTDKTLSNWQLVGAIRRMLPAARIVHCVRDPLETVWSCFRQNFAEGQGFSYNFDELVEFCNDCTRAMDAWQQRHPGTIHVHRHEALLDEPEATIRAALEACGLPFDEACLRFHETRRDVRTASMAQVRSPLTASGSAAARHARRLTSLSERLRPPGPR